MAAGERKQIQGLPQGWVWDYTPGPWQDNRGNKGTGRHAVNYLSGEMINVKQVRNIQRGQQGLGPTPAPQGKQRNGVLYTTRTETKFRGKTVSYSFRTLEEAQAFILQEGIPDDYKQFTVQTRFKNSRIPGKEYPTKGKKYRYATLTPFLMGNARYSQRRWNTVFEKANEFEYDKNSRFYIFATER